MYNNFKIIEKAGLPYRKKVHLIKNTKSSHRYKNYKVTDLFVNRSQRKLD